MFTFIFKTTQNGPPHRGNPALGTKASEKSELLYTALTNVKSLIAFNIYHRVCL